MKLKMTKPLRLELELTPQELRLLVVAVLVLLFAAPIGR